MKMYVCERGKGNFDKDMIFMAFIRRTQANTGDLLPGKKNGARTFTCLIKRRSSNDLLIYLFIYFSLQQNETYFATSLLDSAAI